MAQDIHVAELVKNLKSLSARPLTECSPQEARALYRKRIEWSCRNLVPDEIGGIEDSAFETKDASIPIRIYSPLETPVSSLPVILFFHGGGYVVGGIETSDHIVRRLCHITGAVVVNVDYRLAPEHPFPAAVDDALASVHWAHHNMERLGGNPHRLAVVGASAGGKLATVCSQELKSSGPEIHLQALFYTSADKTARRDASSADVEGYLHTQRNSDWYLGHYAGNADLADPRISPMHYPDLSGAPEAIVVTAEYDPVRDQGNEYALRLADAGVAVKLMCVPSAIHGFLSYGWGVPLLKDYADQAFGWIRDKLWEQQPGDQ